VRGRGGLEKNTTAGGVIDECGTKWKKKREGVRIPIKKQGSKSVQKTRRKEEKKREVRGGPDCQGYKGNGLAKRA